MTDSKQSHYKITRLVHQLATVGHDFVTLLQTAHSHKINATTVLYNKAVRSRLVVQTGSETSREQEGTKKRHKI